MFADLVSKGVNQRGSRVGRTSPESKRFETSRKTSRTPTSAGKLRKNKKDHGKKGHHQVGAAKSKKKRIKSSLVQGFFWRETKWERVAGGERG